LSDSAARQEAKPSFRRDLGRFGILAAVAVMCWAGYTTGSGMNKLMQNVVGTVIGTSAVVITLALTSWLLGGDLAIFIISERRSERPPMRKFVPSLLVFAFVFVISSFFSYTYYYRTVSDLGGKRIAAERQPGALAELVILPLTDAVQETYRRAGEELIKDHAFVRWLDGIEALLSTAGSGGQNFGKKLAENQRRAGEAQGMLLRLQTARAAADSAAKGFQATLAENRDKLAKLNQELAEAQSRRINAESGNDGTGKTGCGRNCRAAQQDIDRITREIEQIHDANRILLQQLNAKQKEIEQLTEQINKLLAEVPGLAQTGGSGGSPAPANSIDLRNQRASIDELIETRKQFKADPTRHTFEAVVRACTPILKTIRDFRLEPSALADFDCGTRREELARLIDQREALNAARIAFLNACSLEERAGITAKMQQLANEVHVDASKSVEVLREARREVEECVLKARNAGAKDAAQKAIRDVDDFVVRNNLDVNDFELARRAMFSLNADSTLALGIAVAQDAFILILKLFTELFAAGRQRTPTRIGIGIDIADRDVDPIEIRAAKALLRLHAPGAGGASAVNLDDADAAALPDAVRMNLRMLLQRFARAGKARWAKDGMCLVDDEVIADIEAEIERRSPQPAKPASGRVTETQASTGQSSTPVHVALVDQNDSARSSNDQQNFAHSDLAAAQPDGQFQVNADRTSEDAASARPAALDIDHFLTWEDEHPTVEASERRPEHDQPEPGPDLAANTGLRPFDAIRTRKAGRT
jgi:predicted  nucleic acid-binding Zn-ribbon protein